MRRGKRREEQVSIAFLDVITCGFGAVVLLFMIARIGEPSAVEAAPRPLDGLVAELQEQLFEIRGEVRVLNRDLEARREQISTWTERVARLQEELRDLDRRQASAVEGASVSRIVEDELRAAKQQLTEEMRRLLADRSRPRTDLVGGVPVDSEYIIFVIDTSASMFQYAWGRMIEHMVQILDVYPNVKGMQVLNDMGQYMFSNYRGQWIPDTPARRQAVVQRLRSWNAFSNSSPVEGIAEAIRTFYSPDKKISIFVLGDEFTGPSIAQAVEMIDRLNRRTSDGQLRVRIHAVGFPVQFVNPRHLQITGIRFAALMREVTRRNGGTFVALQDFR